MADTLQHLIKELKETASINSHTSLIDYLTKIEKYSRDEIEKAYLLGQFFKNKFDPDNLPDDKRKLLLNTIKSAKLENYYYAKQQPERDQLDIFSLILFIGGLFVIAAGIIQLINGNFWVGLGTKYLAFVVREGGQKVILGVLLFIGGFIRYKYEKKKKRFMAALRLSGSKSA
jgi:hypothetical protein